MELDKKNLKSLIERARVIHNKLNDEIESSISFCRVCSDHGRYCDVAETTFTERESLIALKNSLKEVEDMLVYLQKLQSWQLIDRHAALTCLEKSRLYLIEQVTGYQGREFDVVNELNACFGNKNTSFNTNLEDKKKADPAVHKGKRRIFSFLVSCIRRFYLDPGKWQKSVGNAVKLIMISASISSTVHVYQSRQNYCSSRRKNLYSFDDSANTGNVNKNTVTTISKRQLDVFCGRG